ncbi:hypothetical protein AVEN_258717-1 [Araneus ventricosus]|uniref:Uncharacterized protein n=1 Tax=Araneus ventricosus TaxID=182803 RepID=A0A4Y2LPD9_ARAVE|nr:hypothetical protein AVEN_258717-1 [Araneus ventricosus]
MLVKSSKIYATSFKSESPNLAMRCALYVQSLFESKKKAVNCPMQARKCTFRSIVMWLQRLLANDSLQLSSWTLNSDCYVAPPVGKICDYNFETSK